MSFALLLCAAFAGADPSAGSTVLESARNLDAAVTTHWKGAGINSTAACDDATFLRRVWLDLAGRVPPMSEAEKVAKSTAPLDRASVVEKLVDSPEFATYWARLWADYLLNQRPFDTAEFSGRNLQQFLKDSLKANRHYNAIVSDLILADGAMDQSGAVNFLLRYNADPNALAGAVSQKILGLSLQCAECHDHPHASWKQSDFWGLSAFFARLRRMTPSNPQQNEQFAALLERPRGELLVVDKRAKPDEAGNYPTRTVIPQFPGAARREIAADRRFALAAWITSNDNPYFARHAANQVWQRLIGGRLVTTLDPAKATGKPAAMESSPNNSSVILEQLRSDFVASDFDLKRLVQVIVLSESYQRSVADSQSQPSASVRAQDLFAQARSRPLSADQIHLSLGQAFGYFYDDNDHRLAQLTGEDFTYDIPEASFGGESQSLGRSLALFNGEHARGTVDVAAQSLLRIHGDAGGPAHIRHLFLSLLSRIPTDDELDLFLDLSGEDMPQRGLEDVTWVILNSAEFQTNH